MVSLSRPRTPNTGVPPSHKIQKPIPEHLVKSLTDHSTAKTTTTPAPTTTTTTTNPSTSPNDSTPLQSPIKERRSSFGMLLRRSKSGGELKGSKKQRQQAELLRLQQLQAAIPQTPPRLPVLYDGATPPKLHSFGGDERPDSFAIVSGHYHGTGRSSLDPGQNQAAYHAVPMPPMPTPTAASNTSQYGGYVDPYARTESMTHRGRYSYASSAVSSVNSPRRVRRRRDPTPFNILILGARGAGKTSFLNFLKTALALPPKKRPVTRATDSPEEMFGPSASKYKSFKPHFLETEIESERVGLTIWDSEGLDAGIVDLQLREMTSFLESKFEETFTEEMKVVRAPGVQDTHIHCAFLILDPARLDRNLESSNSSPLQSVNGNNPVKEPQSYGPLDANLDIQVLKALEGKTTVIPVIAKADTITGAHMNHLKKSVWTTLKQAGLDPLDALGLDDDVDDRIDEGDETESDILPPSPSTPRSRGQSPREGSASPSREGSSSPNSPASPATDSSKRQSLGSLRQHRRAQSLEPEPEIPYLPLSIISPDIYEPEIIGRKFPWGFADPYNAEHCDFTRLKESIFAEWRAELREASRELWYERWRTSRLKHRDILPAHR